MSIISDFGSIRAGLAQLEAKNTNVATVVWQGDNFGSAAACRLGSCESKTGLVAVLPIYAASKTEPAA